MRFRTAAEYRALKGAVEQGLISEETIDEALTRLLRTKFKLGMFDPEEEVPTPRSLMKS